jgi:two-component system, OmpR family, phosphate regulon sensor histidine kinase PhoR
MAVKPSTEALEHERLQSLINSMADGVIATDDKGTVVLYNGAALDILDSNATISGRPIESILKLYKPDGHRPNVRRLIQATKIPTSSRDYLIHYGDGSRANLYLSIAPVRLGYGQAGQQGFVLLMRDITREKSLEEERDEFISVVSHELRTPIAIAEGNISNAQLIAEKTKDIVKITDALNQAYAQIGFLSGLINDLSTLSRAERGVLEVEAEAINAHDLCHELVEAYQQQAISKGLAIKSDPSPSLELLHSSKLYVREILQNFITNAIKYTDTGSVTIGAEPGNEGVIFTVTDTGIGISKADQDRVFDKFFRSEDFRTRKNNGTGLGLYVTAKLARLIKAEISLDSELNHGTTFTIFIPNLKSSK